MGTGGPVTGLGASQNKAKTLTAANDYDLGTLNPDGAKYGELQEITKYDDKQEIMKAPPSVINRYSLFRYKGMPWNGNELTQNQYNLNANQALDAIVMNPTASALIEKFGNIGSLGMRYTWSDFLYAKYYGKIPNNYMLTLRRYPYPVTDNILDNVVTDSKSGKLMAGDQPDMARAITWMSEATGNKLTDILKFTTKLKWKDVTSKVQSVESKSQGIEGSKFLGIGTTGIGGGSAASSFFTLASGQTTAGARVMGANGGYDPISSTYPNYVEGPLNIIDTVFIRDAGLQFEQSFELTFHYALKSIGDVDPKLAMLDLLSNLLVLTYNTAPFFGGATRFIGNGKFGKPLGDHNKLAAGDVKGFLGSVMSDLGSMLTNVFGDGSGGFTLDSVLGGLGDVAGDMLGGILSKELNTPQQAAVVSAFLSGDPTGCWHLTVGNPFNPICMIGNLILEETEWSLGNTLGRSDFPTELIVKVKLKPGRYRDSADIESMFNAGRGRLYYAPSGLDDVLNLGGKEPIKISGYAKNADQKGTPGDAFNSVLEGNQTNNVDWSKILSKEDYIEGNNNTQPLNRGEGEFGEQDRNALLANNILRVNEG
jgi:hypothetical protein